MKPIFYSENFNWQFKVLSQEMGEAFLNAPTSLPPYDNHGFVDIAIPHTMVETPYNYFSDQIYQVQGHYKKRHSGVYFEQSQQVKIHFEGVMVSAYVFINKQLVHSHFGGYLPFECAIESYIEPGKPFDIDVIVDGTENPEVPPFGFVVDYLTYSGIYREVSIEVCSLITVENCHVKTLNVLDSNKTLQLDLYLSNTLAQPGEYTIEFQLLDKKNTNCIETFSKMVTLTSHKRQRFEWLQTLDQSDHIQLWHPDHPNLYILEISIYEKSHLIDQRQITFGFRTAEFKNDGFYLNGTKFKIRGLNRHQSYPYVGYAMPKSAQIKDAHILKFDLGVNLVRLSHYPQSKHFMNACDDIGLLVFDEIPGWQHIGSSDLWRKRTLQNVEGMIKKDWNHPSVIIWGVRINESQDCDSLYHTTHQLAKSLDSTRATGGVRYIENSHLIEDVYTFNDFSHTGNNLGLKSKKQVTGNEVPYLVTEFNGHMFPTKSFDSEPHRLEHALRHLNVLNQAYLMDSLAGAIGWCAFDYNTHKDFGSGDRICHHGVMNMFRMPKYAAAVYSSQNPDQPFMQVASAMNIGDAPAGLIGETFIFTNCDRIDVYKNDVFVGSHAAETLRFKGIPYPPVVINEFIGNQLVENEGFTLKDAEKLKALFSKLAKAGEAKLTPIDKAFAAKLMIQYRLQYSDLYQLFAKYMNNWGSEATTYRFEGYQNGIKVCSSSKGQTNNLQLKVEADSDTLCIGDTYDVTRIAVSLTDDFNTLLSYTDEVISVKSSGPIEIIGPNQFTLPGGQRAFWIKTVEAPNLNQKFLNEVGTASITIDSPRFGSKTLTFSIC